MAGSDRPLSRSLVKLGARLLLGRNLAHVQDWFPGLSIDERRVLHYRRRPVAALQDMGILIDGPREWIHVVGSGPSVTGADLSRLEPASAILLNGAIHLAGGPVAAPLAVAVEDERFVYRHFDLMRDKIAAGQACRTSGHSAVTAAKAFRFASDWCLSPTMQKATRSKPSAGAFSIAW